MEAGQLWPGSQLVAAPVITHVAHHNEAAHCVSKVEIGSADPRDSLQSLDLVGKLESGASSAVRELLKTSPSDRVGGANGHREEATVASLVADASLSQATRDVPGPSRDRARGDQDELHLQECQQKDDEGEWSCCPNNNNNNNFIIIGVKKDAEIGSGASEQQNNGANSDEKRRILNDTFAVARARDEEPDQAGRRKLDDLGADEAIDLGGASSRGGAQVAAGRRAADDDVCDQADRPAVAGSHAQHHRDCEPLVGEELNKLRSQIKIKRNPAARPHERCQNQKTMIEDFARYQVASQLDALSASLKLASDASDDEANLLNVLHRLGEWRAELRLVDNQLFELMSECFARLGSKSKEVAQEDNKRVLEGSQSLLVDLTPIDLTQASPIHETSSSEKRVKLPSPGINFKKMRLLGSTRHEPLMPEKSGEIVVANQIDLIGTQAQTHTKIDQHKTDESDDQSDEKPELRKFYSIGTAEISREQFNRQQQMFDMTLAKLAKENQKTEATKSVTFDLPPHQDQQYELRSNRMLGTYIASSDINHHPREQTEHQINYHNELMKSLAMTASSSAQRLTYQTCLPGQMQPAQNQSDHFNLELSHMSIIQTNGQLRHNNEALNYTHQPQELVSVSNAHHQDHGQPNHIYQQYQKSSVLGCGNSAFDNLLRSSTNICKDLVPIVRKMAFKCHVCQSCFEDRHRLQQHLSIHLNLHPSWFEEKTIKETMAQYELRRGDYLCHICKVRYETTSEFDKHMHLHGDKPHQCNLCSRESKFVSFRYFRQLLTHLRSHCFLYSCKFAPECRQTANRKDYLKLHILKHHLNNKLPEQYTICCH